MMTTFPFLTCCELLSIDPKTLRSWLRQAHMSLYTHPTDARMKCLTSEQVQRLAVLHGRALKPHEAFVPEHAVPIVRIVRTEAEPMAQREPIPQQDETARRKQIAALEAQVASLQEQLAHLRTPAHPVTLSDPIQQAVEQADGQAGQDGQTGR